MTPLTHAQGLCACENIINLLQALEALLLKKDKASYYDSVKDKVQSIQLTLEEEWSGALTQRMSSALHNIWTGLKKWDRYGLGGSDIFENIETFEERMVTSGILNAAEETLEACEACEACEAPVTKKQKGREERPQPLECTSRGLEPPRAPETEEKTFVKGPKTSPLQATADVKLLDRELVLAAQETLLTELRSLIDRFNIEEGMAEHVLGMDIAFILGHTTSERTGHLLRAAYLTGRIRGIQSLVDALLEA